MTMLTSSKTRPSDGSEEEKKEEESAEAAKQKRISEEETLAKFVAEAEEDHDRIEQQKKEELEKLRKERERNHEQDADGAGNEEKMISGQKVQTQKEYTMKKGFGIFNSKGRRDDFGSPQADKKIERTLKVGAHGVDIKKQREFMQLLGRYHGLKDKNTATFDKDEVLKFEAGMRRGSSDARFKELSSELKQEGVIKNTADVKKFFSKQEVKRMSNALLGRKDQNTYKREDKSELTDRRSGSADPKSMRRF